MSDGGLYSGTFAEQLPFPAPFVIRVGGLRYVRNQYLCHTGLLLAAVAPVARQPFQLFAADALDLLQAPVYRVPVVLVAEREGPEDEPRKRAHNRHLVAELVFLVLLALADALHFRLMDGIDLVLVVPLLVDYPDEDADLPVIAAVAAQVALKLAQQTARPWARTWRGGGGPSLRRLCRCGTESSHSR